MTKQSLILGAAIAGTLSSGVAMADLSGNIGIGSNYIWRGVTQTVDQAATYGGVDWSDDSGVYVGTWVSNVDFSGLGDGYEMDVYAGFSGESGAVGYDVGVVTYQYPVTPNFNFTEVYASITFEAITVGLNATVDAASGNDAEKDPTATGAFEEGDMYLSVATDFETDAGSSVGVYLGSYMFDKDGKDFTATGGADVGNLDYLHYGVSLSKDDFTFALDKNDYDEAGADPSIDNVRFTVSWGKEFAL